MPTNGEKQRRWLMGCKCGARVKASRWSARPTDFKTGPTPICNTCSQIGQASKWSDLMCPGGNPADSSGLLRDDRGVVEHHHGRR
jgi:hypothetical protein